MKVLKEEENKFYRKELILSSLAVVLFIVITIVSTWRYHALGIKPSYASHNFALNILSIFIYFIVLAIAITVLWEIKINWKVLTDKYKLRIPIIVCSSLILIEIYFIIKIIILII